MQGRPSHHVHSNATEEVDELVQLRARLAQMEVNAAEMETHMAEMQ